jgi:uncharacterized alkaline shock family protein YloU
VSSSTSSDLVRRAGSDADTRGRTSVADAVIEKIAAQAALEVPNCVGLKRRIAGISIGGKTVGADAVTEGSITGLHLSVGITYPAPITMTTREIRRHVQLRIQTLCGLKVDHVDITVGEVGRLDEPERRVL